MHLPYLVLACQHAVSATITLLPYHYYWYAALMVMLLVMIGAPTGVGVQ